MTLESTIPGTASGELLLSDTGLSFMGGVDPASGKVIDTHHPLSGQSVAGKILAIPSGRGSCAGSLVIFELLMNGHAPAALIFQHREPILSLGVIIALELFGVGIPVIRLDEAEFRALPGNTHAAIRDGRLDLGTAPLEAGTTRAELPPFHTGSLNLTETDRAMLEGRSGRAVELAMRIIVRTALLDEADGLVDVDMAHIDGCFYQGPGGLRFAQRLVDLEGKVRVPSTMNSLCVDRRQWAAMGVDRELGEPSEALADAYVALGVQPTYTCAPYQLNPAPAFGQQIAWGESNAVVYANSVLGARTMKYPDYLDILVALTGRAPAVDCHVDDRRHATRVIEVAVPAAPDDAFWPLLGYLVGQLSPNDIPVLTGLEGVPASFDDLRAFGAAFATTSAASMFHITGITPEAKTLAEATGGAADLPRHHVTQADFAATWAELNSSDAQDVELVSLGNPHFSATEFAALARLCDGRQKADGVDLTVTCNRAVFDAARAAGHIDTIQAFGGRIVNDTCWCLIGAPIVREDMRTIMTNSGKYAHYGPAATGKGYRFGSLEGCVDAACTGRTDLAPPAWAAPVSG